MISVRMNSNCWIVSQLNTINTFQRPAYHCQLNSYQLSFQEEGNMSPIPGNVLRLPFELKGLKPFTVYTWKLVHNSDIVFMDTTRTLEDGKLTDICSYCF
jgi:hypothetical protein